MVCKFNRWGNVCNKFVFFRKDLFIYCNYNPDTFTHPDIEMELFNEVKQE